MQWRELICAVHERRSTFRDGERGAALVEFVLIVPIFLLLVFGAIEFASAYNDSAVVADAARAGGRIGSTAPGTDYTSTTATNIVTTHVEPR